MFQFLLWSLLIISTSLGEVYPPPRLTFYVQVRGKGRKQHKVSSSSSSTTTSSFPMPSFTNEIFKFTNDDMITPSKHTSPSPITLKVSSALIASSSNSSSSSFLLPKTLSPDIHSSLLLQMKQKWNTLSQSLTTNKKLQNIITTPSKMLQKLSIPKLSFVSSWLQTKPQQQQSSLKQQSPSRPTLQQSSSLSSTSSSSSLSWNTIKTQWNTIPKKIQNTMQKNNDNDEDDSTYMLGWYILCFSCGVMFDTWF